MFLERITISVEEIKDKHCVSKIKEGLLRIENIKKVKIDIEKQEVSIFYNKKKEMDMDKIIDVIQGLGYSFKGVI